MSGSNKRKAGDNTHHNSSLSGILRHFVGLDLAVELKNGRIYRGTLMEADDYMNLVISDCTRKANGIAWEVEFLDPKANAIANANANANANATINHGEGGFVPTHMASSTSDRKNEKHGIDEIDFSIVHIRGPSIRYVHFPDDADLPRLVKNGIDRVRAAKDRYQRGKRTKRSSTT
eukprot:5914_1